MRQQIGPSSKGVITSGSCAQLAVLIVFGLAGVPSPSGPAVLGDEPAENSSSVLDRRTNANKLLDNGQFAAAHRVVLANQDRAARDVQLRKRAVAHLAAGESRDALSVASEIYDDKIRADVSKRVRVRSVGDVATPSKGPLAGGGPQADFDSLIDLITTTIEPDSWDEVGGEGAIQEFESGVYVNPQGLMRRIKVDPFRESIQQLHRKLRTGVSEDENSPSDADDFATTIEGDTTLCRVSLVRLERAVQRRWALGREPTERMRHLAGLSRVRYLLLYPEQRDLVLVGPGGPWHYDDQGRALSTQDGAPVMLLDDLVELLRNAMDGMGRFGCSITPRQANLANAQAFLRESAGRPVAPTRRKRWLDSLRDNLGWQDVEVYGIDHSSRAARVLVEADYHMKLIGMGLAPGVDNVQSYLDGIQLGPDGTPPPMDVLRWWFTLHYGPVVCSEHRDAFEISGQGVRVLSENELLSELGERIHTGESRGLNKRFSSSFTQNFEALSAKYPIYGQLRTVFDLAMVAALIRSEDLASQIDWQAAHFRNADAYQIHKHRSVTTVQSVINYRVLNKKYFVAGVSGGVSANPREFMRTGRPKESAELSEIRATYRTAGED